ncbi:MAG: arginine biosynthesis protein ArgJ, partial [Ruminococcus sp.]
MKDVKKISYDGYKYIDGGVCAAKGFRANGLYSGIKANPTEKYDLCLVVSDVLCNAAGVFT